jgi:hypothetical protein
VAEFVPQDPVVAGVEVIPERDAVEDLAGGRRRAVPGNVEVGGCRGASVFDVASGQAIGSITLPATGGDRPYWRRLQF